MDRKNEMSTVEEEDSDSSVLSEPESVKHSIKVSTINLTGIPELRNQTSTITVIGLSSDSKHLTNYKVLLVK